MIAPQTVDALARVAVVVPVLRLLVLHGSRARGDEHERSDWDFAYLADGDLDELQLRNELGKTTRTDRVDVVNLAGASGLLRFRVARDGMLLYEAERGAFDAFRLEAARFWYDIEGIVRAEHAAALERLV